MLLNTCPRTCHPRGDCGSNRVQRRAVRSAAANESIDTQEE
jgi:hypothetical protein